LRAADVTAEDVVGVLKMAPSKSHPGYKALEAKFSARNVSNLANRVLVRYGSTSQYLQSTLGQLHLMGAVGASPDRKPGEEPTQARLSVKAIQEAYAKASSPITSGMSQAAKEKILMARVQSVLAWRYTRSLPDDLKKIERSAGSRKVVGSVTLSGLRLPSYRGGKTVEAFDNFERSVKLWTDDLVGSDIEKKAIDSIERGDINGTNIPFSSQWRGMSNLVLLKAMTDSGPDGGSLITTNSLLQIVHTINLVDTAAVEDVTLDDKKADALRASLMRSFMAIDTLIDYSDLTVQVMSFPENVRAQYQRGLRVLNIGDEKYFDHSIPHELGHYLAEKWYTEGFGTTTGQSMFLYKRGERLKESDLPAGNLVPERVEWMNQMREFVASLTPRIQKVTKADREYSDSPDEVFARFLSGFVKWTEKNATGITSEKIKAYDRFSEKDFKYFAQLLQVKQMIDLGDSNPFGSEFSNGVLPFDVAKWRENLPAPVFRSAVRLGAAILNQGYTDVESFTREFRRVLRDPIVMSGLGLPTETDIAVHELSKLNKRIQAIESSVGPAFHVWRRTTGKGQYGSAETSIEKTVRPEWDPIKNPISGGSGITVNTAVRKNVAKGTIRVEDAWGNKHDVKVSGFNSGGRNFDVGAGRDFKNKAGELYHPHSLLLETLGVSNTLWDPENQPDAVEGALLEIVEGNLNEAKKFDTATISDVLNVIESGKERGKVIAQAANAIKSDGEAYFTVYWAKGKKAGKTSKGYQLHWPEEAYLKEIGVYFGDVKLHKSSGLIIARDPKPLVSQNIPEKLALDKHLKELKKELKEYVKVKGRDVFLDSGRREDMFSIVNGEIVIKNIHEQRYKELKDKKKAFDNRKVEEFAKQDVKHGKQVNYEKDPNYKEGESKPWAEVEKIREDISSKLREETGYSKEAQSELTKIDKTKSFLRGGGKPGFKRSYRKEALRYPAIIESHISTILNAAHEFWPAFRKEIVGAQIKGAPIGTFVRELDTKDWSKERIKQMKDMAAMHQLPAMNAGSFNLPRGGQRYHYDPKGNKFFIETIIPSTRVPFDSATGSKLSRKQLGIGDVLQRIGYESDQTEVLATRLREMDPKKGLQMSAGMMRSLIGSEAFSREVGREGSPYEGWKPRGEDGVVEPNRIFRKVDLDKIGKGGLSAYDVVEKEMVGALKANLIDLYGSYPSDLATVSADWYYGANKIVHDIAYRYSSGKYAKLVPISAEQVAGVIAALSPQTDWNQNLARAERSIAIHRDFELQSNKVFGAIDFHTYLETLKASRIESLKEYRSSLNKADTESGKDEVRENYKTFLDKSLRELRADAKYFGLTVDISVALNEERDSEDKGYLKDVEFKVSTSPARDSKDRSKEVKVFRRWDDLPIRWKSKMIRAYEETDHVVREVVDIDGKEVEVALSPKYKKDNKGNIKRRDGGGQYFVYDPTGKNTGQVDMNKSDAGVMVPTSMTWGSYNELSKAVSILEDGRASNIHSQIGSGHKVRSFFINIIAPEHANAVTIDTHAIGAAFMKSVGSKDDLVKSVMSGTPMGDVGVIGLNPIVAEAYIQAAEELNLLPRELQSVTWEAARGLFPGEFKKLHIKDMRDEMFVYGDADTRARLIKEKELSKDKKAPRARTFSEFTEDLWEQYHTGVFHKLDKDSYPVVDEKGHIKTVTIKDKDKALKYVRDAIYSRTRKISEYDTDNKYHESNGRRFRGAAWSDAKATAPVDKGRVSVRDEHGRPAGVPTGRRRGDGDTSVVRRPSTGKLGRVLKDDEAYSVAVPGARTEFRPEQYPPPDSRLGRYSDAERVWSLQLVASVMGSMDRDVDIAPPSYSELANLIREKTRGGVREKVSRDEVMAWVRDPKTNNPRNGVKLDELEFLGFDLWLQSQGPKLKTSDILNFIENNTIEIVEFSNYPLDPGDVGERRRARTGMSPDEIEALSAQRVLVPSRPLHGEWTVRGGHNYRTMALVWRPKRPDSGKPHSVFQKGFLELGDDDSPAKTMNYMEGHDLYEEVDPDFYQEAVNPDFDALGLRLSVDDISQIRFALSLFPDPTIDTALSESLHDLGYGEFADIALPRWVAGNYMGKFETVGDLNTFIDDYERYVLNPPHPGKNVLGWVRTTDRIVPTYTDKEVNAAWKKVQDSLLDLGYFSRNEGELEFNRQLIKRERELLRSVTKETSDAEIERIVQSILDVEAKAIGLASDFNRAEMGLWLLQRTFNGRPTRLTADSHAFVTQRRPSETIHEGGRWDARALKAFNRLAINREGQSFFGERFQARAASSIPGLSAFVESGVITDRERGMLLHDAEYMKHEASNTEFLPPPKNKFIGSQSARELGLERKQLLVEEVQSDWHQAPYEVVERLALRYGSILHWRDGVAKLSKTEVSYPQKGDWKKREDGSTIYPVERASAPDIVRRKEDDLAYIEERMAEFPLPNEVKAHIEKNFKEKKPLHKGLDPRLAFYVYDTVSREFRTTWGGKTTYDNFLVLPSEQRIGMPERYRSTIAGHHAKRSDIKLLPEAPLKREWVMNAMRRVIRRGVEGGYDSIAWTDAETQRKRWSSQARPITKVEWSTNELGMKVVHLSLNISGYGDAVMDSDRPSQIGDLTISDTGIILSVDQSPESHRQSIVTAEEFFAPTWHGFVGRPLHRAISDEVRNRVFGSEKGSITPKKGKSVLISDTAFSGFYDGKLRNDTRRYVKQWGVEPKHGTVASLRAGGVYEAEGIWEFDVTDDMRSGVAHSGLAAYNKEEVDISIVRKIAAEKGVGLDELMQILQRQNIVVIDSEGDGAAVDDSDSDTLEVGRDVARLKESRDRNPLPDQGDDDDTPLMPVNEIIEKLGKAVGNIQVSVGGTLGAWGKQNRKTKSIWLKRRDDLQIFAHEIGHHLHQSYLFARTRDAKRRITKAGRRNRELEKLFIQELLILGERTAAPKATRKRQMQEGEAEFFLMWSRDPDEARMRAPQYYKYFEERLGKIEPRLREAIREFQAESMRHYNARPSERASSRIAPRGAARARYHDVLLQYEVNWINELAPIKRAVREMQSIKSGREMTLYGAHMSRSRNAVEDVLGESDMPDTILTNAFRMAELAKGSTMKARGFIQHGVQDRESRLISPRNRDGSKRKAFWDKKGPDDGGLVAALQPVLDGASWSLAGRTKDLEIDLFNEYLVMAHVEEAQAAYERRNPGKKFNGDEATGITVEEANQFMKDNASSLKTFREAAKNVNDYQDALLEYAVEEGLLSRDDVNRMRSTYQNYIPLNRLNDEIEVGVSPYLKEKVIGGPLQRRRGSTALIIPPLETIVKNTFLLVDTAEANKAMQVLTDQAEQLDAGTGLRGSANWLERIQPKKQLVVVPRDVKKIKEELASGPNPIIIPDDLDLNAMISHFQPTLKTGPNEIYVFKNGEKQLWRVNDPQLMTAIRGFATQNPELFNVIFKGPAQLLRQTATSTFEFMLRNPLRDSLQAVTTSRHGFKPWDFFNGLFQIFRSTRFAKRQFGHSERAVYQAFLNSGAGGHTLGSLDRNTLQEELRRLNLYEQQSLFASIPNNLIELMRGTQEALENATRVGEFMRAVNKLESKGVGREEAYAQGAYSAAEVTVNFKRFGTYAKQINNMHTFFNAAVQGKVRLFEVFKRDPLGASIRALSSVTVLSVALWFLNKDDEEYDELPDHDKDAYWHINSGFLGIEEGREGYRRHGWMRIPKPWDLGVVFANVPEAILDFTYSYYKNGDMTEEEWNEFSEQLGFHEDTTEQVAWGLFFQAVPIVVVPVVEVFSNYSFFRRAPIVSPYLEGVAPELKGNRYTSETARTIARNTGWPAGYVDHMVQGYTAGIGKYVTDTIDKGIYAVSDPDTPETPIRGSWITNTWGLKGIFRGTSASGSASSLADFYDLRARVEGANQTYNALLNADRYEAAIEYEDENLDLLDLTDAVRTTSENLRKKRNEINAVFNEQAGLEPVSPWDVKGLYKRSSVSRKIREEKGALIEDLWADMVNEARYFFNKGGIY
jgi:hypothetical protein